MLWKTLILKYGGVITSALDLTSLAKLSDSYAPGHIHDTIVEVLTERRLAKMSKHPLQATDFIPGLSHHNAIYKEEEDAYKVNDINLFFLFLINFVFSELVEENTIREKTGTVFRRTRRG